VYVGFKPYHSSSLIHFLFQPNILVDSEGNPRLFDFANCSFTKNTGPINVSTPIYSRTIRWSAPERLCIGAKEKEPTTMSDVYSLSMIIVEVCMPEKL